MATEEIPLEEQLTEELRQFCTELKIRHQKMLANPTFRTFFEKKEDAVLTGFAGEVKRYQELIEELETTSPDLHELVRQEYNKDLVEIKDSYIASAATVAKTLEKLFRK